MAPVLDPPLPENALRRIRAAVGKRGWIADPGAMAPYLTEQRGLYRGSAALVVRPATTAEVASVVRICAEAGIAIVPQGGNTGLCGGAAPNEHGGEILLSLGRLNRIRAIDPANFTITAEAGCVLADVRKAAAVADRLFPLSLAAEGSAQIGGNLSTNAGGINVLRYGTARDLTLGIEAVLPDGSVLDGLRGLRKDTSGYDLKQLFIGSEGTLGVVTAAVLKLFPLPREVEAAFVALPSSAAAVELLALARAGSGDLLTAFELMSRRTLEFVLSHSPGAADPLARPAAWYALIEMSSGAIGGARQALEQVLGTAIEAGVAQDAVLAASEAQRAALWRLRESASEAQRAEGGSIKHDVSVPVSRIADFIAGASRAVEAVLPGIRVVAFGHVGDGNIHFNLSQPVGADRAAFLSRWSEFNRIVHDIAAAMGGSISAEHGIGQLKRGELARYRSPVEIELMRAVKQALDPKGIMNPGKVVP